MAGGSRHAMTWYSWNVIALVLKALAQLRNYEITSWMVEMATYEFGQQWCAEMCVLSNDPALDKPFSTINQIARGYSRTVMTCGGGGCCCECDLDLDLRECDLDLDLRECDLGPDRDRERDRE